MEWGPLAVVAVSGALVKALVSVLEEAVAEVVVVVDFEVWQDQAESVLWVVEHLLLELCLEAERMVRTLPLVLSLRLDYQERWQLDSIQS